MNFENMEGETLTCTDKQKDKVALYKKYNNTNVRS